MKEYADTKKMRVIQIGIDIAIDDSTDVQVIMNEIMHAIGHYQVEGIQQSDYSWSYDDYIHGNINK